MADAYSACGSYRCRVCIDDEEMRLVDAERFELDAPEDYRSVLKHAVEEHSEADAVQEIVAGLRLTTPCANCEELFVTPIHVGHGDVVVRNYCDNCGEADELRRLFYRTVGLGEILPEVAPDAE